MGTVREENEMSRYIDAEALIADMRERYCKPCQERKEDYNGVRCRACWVDDAMDDVDGFADNSIDIVRCKECRYCKRKKGTFKGEPIIFYRCEENNRDVENDDYCSYGERSE